MEGERSTASTSKQRAILRVDFHAHSPGAPALVLLPHPSLTEVYFHIPALTLLLSHTPPLPLPHSNPFFQLGEAPGETSTDDYIFVDARGESTTDDPVTVRGGGGGGGGRGGGEME